ncbi:MAG: 5-oxoprolinase subunit PxpB [Nitrospiraceae bacterium]
MPRYPRVLAAGDAAVTVEFGETIAPEINDRVMAFAQAVEGLGLDWLIETVPTYRSATVYFDPVVIEADQLAERLLTLAESLPQPSARPSRQVDIPVAYGGEFGPDLADVASFASLSVEETITLHASVEYRVYMLGFSPGFPYLGVVPDALAMPRLSTPRAKVPAGSVGIAGSQTGIYPLDTPGGWRVIGRTPLRLYDQARPKPFLLEPGDSVRFVSIDRQEFERLAAEMNH